MIIINEDWCKGCNICINHCPVEALEESDQLNRRGVYPPRLKKDNTCNYCRLCELLCPDLAITVKTDEPDKVKDTEKKLQLRPITGGKK